LPLLKKVLRRCLDDDFLSGTLWSSARNGRGWFRQFADSSEPA
jgi:hypothetical protein